MTPEAITAIMKETLFVALELASPFLILVLAVGILVSFLQSVTRIQEMTLSFVPKMIILTVALVLFFPWMIKILTKFTHNILIVQWDKVIQALHYGN